MIIHYRNYFAGQIRLLRRVSFFKALNFLGIQSGYLYSKLSGKAKVWAFPFSVTTETSAVCNLKCPECIAGMGKTLREAPFMDVSTFKNIIRRHSRHSFFVNLYFQGEPFLNTSLTQMVEIASENGYYTCVSTNGHFLDNANSIKIIKAGLDHIIISLDGLTQESYSFYRRSGELKRVTDGIKALIYARNTLGSRNPLVEIQFLVNRRNIGEISELKAYCKDLGVDRVTLKTMQVYGKNGAEHFLPSESRFNRYARKSKIAAAAQVKPCYRLWSHIVYTSSGLIVPCCYDKVPQHPIGISKNKQPGELWFSPGFNSFRERVINNPQDISICSNCGQ